MGFFQDMLNEMSISNNKSIDVTKVAGELSYATPFVVGEKVYMKQTPYRYQGVFTGPDGSQHHVFKEIESILCTLEPIEFHLKEYSCNIPKSCRNLTPKLAEWYEKEPRSQLQLDLGRFFRLITTPELKVSAGPSSPKNNKEQEEVVQLLLDIPELQELLYKTMAIEGWDDRHLQELRLKISSTDQQVNS